LTWLPNFLKILDLAWLTCWIIWLTWLDLWLEKHLTCPALGLLDVKDIFYGRQTIREEAVSKFDQYIHQIRSLLKEPIKQHCIAS